MEILLIKVAISTFRQNPLKISDFRVLKDPYLAAGFLEDTAVCKITGFKCKCLHN